MDGVLYDIYKALEALLEKMDEQNKLLSQLIEKIK